ncbi:MAG TPA: bifunctional metallophosphatase/5'-nucleotidase [Gemmatimonadales bacterium]|nr:bifunctional metallophosphatase/5'-nucleotidase [Gemmatimonadales bacterium]
MTGSGTQGVWSGSVIGSRTRGAERGVLLVLALLTACGTGGGPTTGPAPDPAAIHVTLLHINDVYEITPVEAGKSGGLARVATVLARLRQENPATRMLLAGDFVSPSALGTARLNGERLGGRQMIAVLNAAGLDAATLGNHEFDISEAQLGQRIQESRFAYVVTNVTDSVGRPLLGIPRHLILRVTDARGRTARVALVGATVDQVHRPNLRYVPNVDALRRELALIRDSADVFVALTHLRLADDVTLADSLPELDLILGGHEHENWSIRRGDRFTPIVKADANVRSVAIVDLLVRPGARPFVNWRIVTITDSIPETPAVAAEAKRWTTIAYDAFRKDGLEPERTIATLPAPLDAREVMIRNGENDFTRLVTQALLKEAPGADVALMNSGSIRLDDVLPPGAITEYDVIRLLPFGGKVIDVEMTGTLLQQVLEQGEKNRGIGGFLLRAGAERGPSGWIVGGAPLDLQKRYRVVCPDFLVSGGEQNLGFLKEGNPGLAMRGPLRDIRLVVIAELMRRYGK